MKAKVGDVVHVRGVVILGQDRDGDYAVSFINSFGEKGREAIAYSEIVHVEPAPAPLKVGDVVNRNGQPFTVILTTNSVVLLRDEVGYITADLDDLERVP